MRAVGVVVGNPVVDEVRRDAAFVRHATGGTATYATLAMRALGLDAALVGGAGHDHADMLRAPLAAAGVDLCALRVVPDVASTAYLLDYEGEPPVRRVALLHRGPVIGTRELPAPPARAAFVHVGPVACEVLPGAVEALATWGVPLATDLHALRRFSGEGAVRLGTGAETGSDFSLFDSVKGAVDEVLAFAPGADGVADAMRGIARLGVRHVFATDGRNGALLLADDTIFEVPPFPVPVEVDATGAGDVFLAGFLFARFVRGEPSRDAALFGAAAASFVVEGPGTEVLGDERAVDARRAAIGPTTRRRSCR